MRIVGGSHRGKKLASPSGLTIRPTSERTREALFNILIHQKYGNFVLKDAKVLDLFAGTGAIGLEALSRGAKELTAVEINQVALNCLHQNISSLGFSSQTNIIEANAVTLRPANDQDSKHSLIFLDPPYKEKNIIIYNHNEYIILFFRFLTYFLFLIT